MKKLASLFFASLMLASVLFVGGATTGTAAAVDNQNSSAPQVTVRKKRKPGAIRRIYRGGKWVGTQVWTGTKWVSRKTWQGMKWTGKKTYKTGRKVVSRTKKVVY